MMPFYFALPRSGRNTLQSRQGTGRTEYLRTSPTTLSFTTSVLMQRAQYFLANNLHAIALSSIAGEKSGVFDKSFVVDCPSRLIYTSIKSDETIRLSLPKMSFKFERLTDAQESRLMEMGLEERNIKGKGRIWVGQVNTVNAMEVVSFSPVHDYLAMGGTVSVRGVEALTAILRIISMAAQTLTLANAPNDPKSTCVIEFTTTAQPLSVMEFNASNLTPVSNEVVSRQIQTTTPRTQILARQPLPRIWGDLENISEIVSHGIFCPFEPNYSQTDRHAIQVLLSEFSCICTDLETFNEFDEELNVMWLKEICLSMEGEFISHMIACLCLAKKIGARVHFLTMEQLYEGTILYGASDLSFKLVGGVTHRALNLKDLQDDILKYAFHSSTLQSILKEVGVGPEEHNMSPIKSMRRLRNIILGKLGQVVQPVVQSVIEKKLLFLNFREKPESINASTLSNLVSYIHPTVPKVIPDTVYLDRRAFFSQDSITVALSMFGIYAPSPIIGGVSMHLAASSESSTSIAKEPNTIQFAKKELLVAADDWRNFARGGTIAQPGNKTKRGVQFRGAEKTEIWGLLLGYAGAGLSAKKNEVESKKREMRSGDMNKDADNDGNSAGKKVIKSQIDFSIFTLPDL